MPRLEVTHLEMEPSRPYPDCVGLRTSARVIFAATHSQGIWKLRIDK